MTRSRSTIFRRNSSSPLWLPRFDLTWVRLPSQSHCHTAPADGQLWGRQYWGCEGGLSTAGPPLHLRRYGLRHDQL